MNIRLGQWSGGQPPDMATLLARLRATGHDYVEWGNGPGEFYAVHSHAYRKHIVCLSGSIRFTLPAAGEAIDLEAGDELDMPPGTEHAATVGPNGVRCAEAHL